MNADESGESWVCTGCIGEAFLRSCIEKEGTRRPVITALRPTPASP